MDKARPGQRAALWDTVFSAVLSDSNVVVVDVFRANGKLSCTLCIWCMCVAFRFDQRKSPKTWKLQENMPIPETQSQNSVPTHITASIQIQQSHGTYNSYEAQKRRIVTHTPLWVQKPQTPQYERTLIQNIASLRVSAWEVTQTRRVAGEQDPAVTTLILTSTPCRQGPGENHRLLANPARPAAAFSKTCRSR